MTRSIRRLSAPREKVIADIVRLLTPGYPALDPAERRAVLIDVTSFVGSQIQALPDFLRLPYKLAITAFDWLPTLRWLRTFRGLDEERKGRYLAEWSEGRLSVMRNFVKLIRGCALLAYYDHETVRRALDAQRGGAVAERTVATAQVG